MAGDIRVVSAAAHQIKNCSTKRGCCISPLSARCARHFPRKRGKLIYSYPKPSPLSRGAVNVSQSHIAVARVLGTFSHTTCYPISFVLWTCFLDRSARGTAQAVEGAQRRGCCTKFATSCNSPFFDSFGCSGRGRGLPIVPHSRRRRRKRAYIQGGESVFWCWGKCVRTGN